MRKMVFCDWLEKSLGTSQPYSWEAWAAADPEAFASFWFEGRIFPQNFAVKAARRLCPQLADAPSLNQLVEQVAPSLVSHFADSPAARALHNRLHGKRKEKSPKKSQRWEMMALEALVGLDLPGVLNTLVEKQFSNPDALSDFLGTALAMPTEDVEQVLPPLLEAVNRRFGAQRIQFAINRLIMSQKIEANKINILMSILDKTNLGLYVRHLPETTGTTDIIIDVTESPRI
jgi:hypothetical protein